MPELTHPARVLLLSAIGTRINPYIGLLRDGLVAAGADVRLCTQLSTADLGPAWHPDVIHLHWLERYDRPLAILARRWHGADDLLRRGLRRTVETAANLLLIYRARRWARLYRLFAQLRDFQRDGGRVAYTLHNLEPHEDTDRGERWGAARMLRLADVVHVHDPSTAAALAARYGRQHGVAVIPHGHYIDSYPNQVSRAEARSRLGVPEDACVYLCLGLLRPYKGLEELVPAFRRLPDPDARLILAGQAGSSEYLATLSRLAGDDTRVMLEPRLIPGDELQFYFNAADLAVLPYRQITTSGAALLALSFGVPILAPAIGAFPDLIAGRRGLLYAPTEPDALSRALAGAWRADWCGARAEIIAWVRQFDWCEIGRRLLEAYG